MKRLKLESLMMQVLMMFLVSIIIFFVTTLLATKLSFEWGMLWFGMGLVILTIFIHSAAYTNSHYKTLYVVCFVVNMIGTGLSFGTFFNVESVVFRGYLIPFVVAGSLLIAYLYTLMFQQRIGKANTSIRNLWVVLIGIGMVSAVGLWMEGSNIDVALMIIFAGIYLLAYIAFLHFLLKSAEVYRLASFYSFGIYIIITIVVISILLEDGFAVEALFTPGDGNTAKQNQNIQ
ncbi:hypothetical protein [Erysipelothrix aquatica]|uniref:hypothetical protein n=1 Tax=Erysipelothrix aquatica TaxID=2683714 RepID=UPI00202CBA76|nr:hypothetical protein [Erysipelothrix aquatica]